MTANIQYFFHAEVLKLELKFILNLYICENTNEEFCLGILDFAATTRISIYIKGSQRLSFCRYLHSILGTE